ncbi:hypothetical protein [Homoserinimonas hongtaonis]|uniref:hypothetical protein n=1 Tax=Homoserinimonas hongtaonis TaxID=2079791 RepID=UPI000D3B778A|nr:hypothetical protein [Salinibacterium hongtaonis]AWB89443.1 hypothetical protein C2138_07735 [Salinibacterium hongtaonis]
MSIVQATTTIDLLAYLHQKLHEHFTDLHGKRDSLAPPSPVFALEHALSQADYQLLESSVRSAISSGLGAKYRTWWLPFVVYAAESGYDYVGNEYWTSFETATPGWQSDQRHWIKLWFSKFAHDYGGVVPSGAFAKTFTIISWPLSHAVLPVYLQRQLAQLLFEFRAGLTSTLLNDLDELGERLAVRAHLYSDRFRIFCQNTALLGRVAAALLSGEEEESPYLVKSTLDRLVEGLSRERESRQWLASARQAASRVRSSGFGGSRMTGRKTATLARQPLATDPKLFMRLLDGVWNAYAELPDMTSLSERLPHVYEELRSCRGVVTGASRPVPKGGLVFPGQEVRFDSWPDPLQPFVTLERGSGAVNTILADQCVISRGPWWLYRTQGTGLAVEVKGGFLRPSHSYILVGAIEQAPPPLPWCEPIPLRATGAAAYRLDVPEQLSENDAALLVSIGLSTLSTITVRPVGIVASSWDGEGAAEWLAGESAIIGIRSELIPVRCLVTVDGHPHFVPWSEGHSELILAVDELEVGAHSISAVVIGADDRELSTGVLAITVRDPLVRPENASKGEGIRMLASPARPTLAELWDGRATITVDCAPGASAEIVVRLRNAENAEIALIRRKVVLPIDGDEWASLAEIIRADRLFGNAYEDAEVCVIEAHRDGLGLASLTFERGFRPLRWQFLKRGRGDEKIAKLHDRTDGGDTEVTYFAVETPFKGIVCERGNPVPLLPRGGLLCATAGDARLAALAPTNPNAVLALGRANPSVPELSKTIAGVMSYVDAHHMWARAELPADAFAVHEQGDVLDAIARANASVLGGSHWAALERKLARAEEPADYLEEMQESVGITASHKSLAADIGRNLYRWSEPVSFVSGFDEVLASTLKENGVANQPSAARFLLTFAGQPGRIIAWSANDRVALLRNVIDSPVLLRAARFAVLGTRALNDPQFVGRGF